MLEHPDTSQYRFYATRTETTIVLISPFDETWGKEPKDRYKVVIPFTEESQQDAFCIKPFGIFEDGKLLVAENYSIIHLFEPTALDSKDEYPKLDSKELNAQCYTMRHFKAKDQMVVKHSNTIDIFSAQSGELEVVSTF